MAYNDSMSVKSYIAKAIKKADKSYFFENYSKQANSVIKGLKKEGYTILPSEPDEELLKLVADTIHTGRMRPEQHIANVYKTLVSHMEKRY
ncbi:MAG: hypothetical protein CMM94_02865 [Rickettsiales bacterium]|nr:hypothetical protein [Rickettsiales bacterium]